MAAPPGAPAGEPAYLEKLQRRAAERDLSESPQWHALLHYGATALGGVESRADDPDFFFAKEGKRNPEAELKATLRAFFRPPEPHQPVAAGEKAEQHPQCAFPARYRWLERKLGFDPSRLPERPCPRFEWWRDQLDVAGVTLVFPAAYLNNPSSMFGHTLLRLDREGQTPETRLLAYTVNYAARTGDDGGMLFAVKGLTGFYPGYYSIAPYYEKIEYYSDLESRDIWEYQLRLEPVEVDRLVRHLWELRGKRFSYYFFDENCSYQLLALLEAARPSLNLVHRGRLDYWAIPADVVRAVESVPGLLGEVTYRPSLESRLVYRSRHLKDPWRDLAKRLGRGRIAPDAEPVAELPARGQARTLELANTYLRYLKIDGQLSREQSAERSRRLLVARSRLDVPDLDRKAKRPRVRPDRGHRSARLLVGAGIRGGSGYQEIQVRPAYHDLLDPDGGYVQGAQISVLEATIRRYERDDAVEFHGVRLADILSLAPRDRFRKPISWKINTGVERYPIATDGDFTDRPWRWRINGGAGLTWALGSWGLGYAFLEGTADVSGHLGTGWAFGAGPALGLVADPMPRWRLHLRVSGQRFGLGQEFTEAEARLGQGVRITRNHALRLSVSGRSQFGTEWIEGRLMWAWYL